MQGIILLCSTSSNVAALASFRRSVERPPPLILLAGRMRLIVYSARRCFEVLEQQLDQHVLIRLTSDQVVDVILRVCMDPS